MRKIVISLGGSLVVPSVNKIDTRYLKRFKEFILKLSKRTKVFIIVGGGKTTRFYQEAAKKLKIRSNDKLDWIGIFSNRLNACLIKNIFDKNVYEEIIIDPTKKIKTNNNIFIGAGWKPGWSTDYVGIKVCQANKIKEILNLTNVDYICSKDPDIFKNVTPFKFITWKEYFKITGRDWTPGAHYPFDPIASKLAQKLKIKVISINGQNLRAVENYLTGKEFVGTIIK